MVRTRESMMKFASKTSSSAITARTLSNIVAPVKGRLRSNFKITFFRSITTHYQIMSRPDGFKVPFYILLMPDTAISEISWIELQCFRNSSSGILSEVSFMRLTCFITAVVMQLARDSQTQRTGHMRYIIWTLKMATSS